jgi:hypothetical protein
VPRIGKACHRTTPERHHSVALDYGEIPRSHQMIASLWLIMILVGTTLETTKP